MSDWRADTLDRIRALIRDADPAIVETRKWRKPRTPDGVPVWERDGILTTGETYKTCVKLTFAHGAALPDPTGLFNAGFGGGVRRAIDLKEGETPHAEAFKALVREAVAFNQRKTKSR